MKVVKVYGSLKKRLGQGTFEFDVATPAQAIKALCANFEGLEKWFIDNDQDGLGYRVLIGKQDIGEDNIEELCYPWSEKEVFSITPIVAGSGGSTGLKGQKRSTYYAAQATSSLLAQKSFKSGIRKGNLNANVKGILKKEIKNEILKGF